MKKKPIIILAAVIVFALVIVIIALSGGSDNALKGTFKLVDASGTDSEMFKATSGDVILEIKDDGSGTLTMLGQTTDVALDSENSKISFDGGLSYTTYVWKDGKLTIENNGNKAVFKKK